MYDPAFSANKMVGVVGALDVTCHTWFGTKFEYVVGGREGQGWLAIAGSRQGADGWWWGCGCSLCLCVCMVVSARHQLHALHAHHRGIPR